MISDCIHAVAAVDPVFGRGHYPLIRIGDPASRFLAQRIVVRSFERHGIDQAAFDNSWLIPPGAGPQSDRGRPPAANPAAAVASCVGAPR